MKNNERAANAAYILRFAQINNFVDNDESITDITDIITNLLHLINQYYDEDKANGVIRIAADHFQIEISEG